MLDMVMSADLDYEAGMLADGTDVEGALTAETAKLVRYNTWQGSNAEAVMVGPLYFWVPTLVWFILQLL